MMIGKRGLPEVKQIYGDAPLYTPIRYHNVAYGNPSPKIKKPEAFIEHYKGNEFEYKVIEHASKFSSYGVWIVPQGSAGFVYSGAQYYDRRESPKYKKFSEQTGWTFEAGGGIDTSIYRDQWNGTNVVCEVVTVEY